MTDAGGGDMRMLVEQIAQALVDAPEQVQVTPVEDGDATILELRVAQSDLGKVIGRQGRTAKSIRTILGAASMKFKKRYMLEIIEEEEGEDAAVATYLPLLVPLLLSLETPVGMNL